MTEDELFPLWKVAEGAEKERLTVEMIRLLTHHANAIVYLTLGTHYKEPVNEAVFRALTRSDSYRGESKFSTWFHSVTQRICMDYVRRLPTCEDELDENAATENPEDAWIEAIDLELAVAKLSKRERELVEFRRLGMSNRDVAEKFEVDPSTVHYWWKGIWEKIKCRM